MLTFSLGLVALMSSMAVMTGGFGKLLGKKELAVMSLSLRKTQWEDILSENGAFSDIRRTVLFEPTRLTNEANARQKACLAIHKAGDVTFKDMRTTISNLWDALTRLDPTWCLEHCFLMNHAEAIVVSLLEKQAQEMFPKDDYTPSLDVLVGGLDKLSKSKLCQACGMDAFNDIQGLIGMIESVKKGSGPEVAQVQHYSASFKLALKGLERYCTFSNFEGIEEEVFGRKVLTMAFEKYSAVVAESGATIAIDNLNMFKQFRWMSTQKEMSEVSKWRVESVQLYARNHEKMPIEDAIAGTVSFEEVAALALEDVEKPEAGKIVKNNVFSGSFSICGPSSSRSKAGVKETDKKNKLDISKFFKGKAKV